MSDSEATAVEAPVEEVAPVEGADEPVEEKPALTLPKDGSRVKKPVRPDDTELKAQTELLQGQINKAKLRIQQIGQAIEDKRSGRGEGSKEQQAVRSKLAELRQQFQAGLAQKQLVRGQLETAKKTRENVRASLRDLKSNMKFTTVEQIDVQIAQLEERVNHSTLTLNEEKRILEDIKKLKQSRSTVGQYSEKLTQLSQDESATDDLMARLKALDEELNKIKAQEDVLREQLAEIRAKEAEKSSDIPSLIQEREECREISKQAYEKIKDLRAEHNVKWEEFKTQQQLWNLQWQEDKKRKQETYLAERARRDAERAARMAELAGEPFDKEVTMCEQVLNYLSKYVAAEAVAAEEKKADVAAPAGFALMQKKEAEEDAWIMGVGKKAGKGGKGKAKKAEERKAAPPGDEKLVHSLDILEAFTTLKLEVPLTKAKVPGVLEDVRAKKEHFLQKREEVKENGVPAIQPEEPAEEAAPEEAAAVAAQPKGGKGKKNGRLEAPNLDDENFPSIGGAPAAAAAAPAPAAAAEAPTEAEAEAEAEEAEPEAPAEAEPEAEAEEAAAAPAGEGVTVSLTVSDEDSVALAILAH